MIVLDTDHLSEVLRGTSAEAQRITARIDQSTDEIAITIVSVEELMRGWLALIHRLRDPHAQIHGYGQLKSLLDWLGSWNILGWDSNAADLYASMRQQKVRVKAMDLKIACIALVHHASVATRNQRDFGFVPGLTVEDWSSVT